MVGDEPEPCPPNSHRISGVCVCDSGYHNEGGVCVPDEQVDGEFDNQGVFKLYQTKTGFREDGSPIPPERYADMSAPWASTYSDNLSESQCEGPLSDGSWRISGGPRWSLWSPNNSRFRDVEFGAYVFLESGSGRIMQPYRGGGEHNSATGEPRCDGFAYKSCLWDDGRVSFRKEICHAAYCSDRWNGTQGGTVNVFRNKVGTSIRGRWWGWKVCIFIDPTNSNRVIMEIWLDEGCDNNGQLVMQGNVNRWRKVLEVHDVASGMRNGVPYGSWTAGSDYADCGYCENSSDVERRTTEGFVDLRGKVVVRRGSRRHTFDRVMCNAGGVIRTDGAVYRVRYFATREIIAPSQRVPVGGTSGDLVTGPTSFGFDRIANI